MSDAANVRPRVRVKICGITRFSEAEDAIKLGVDALGLVFVPTSKRFISTDFAKALCEKLPPYISVVGLFADQSASEIREILQTVPLDQLQFHGNESPEFCAQFGRRWYKAVPMNDLENDEALCDYFARFSSSSALLLDAFGKQSQGGSGKTFTWRTLPQNAPQSALDKPLIIAGGLTPENVGAAVRHFAPFAVDVSSGVEEVGQDGTRSKSFAKMQAFITALEQAYDV